MFWARSGTDVLLTPALKYSEVGLKWREVLHQTRFIFFIEGLAVGSVFSLLLFKRKMWPVTFGIGSGFGMGYSNCEHELNEPYMVHIKNLKKLEE